jgi:hypothetical protein
MPMTAAAVATTMEKNPGLVVNAIAQSASRRNWLRPELHSSSS